MKVTIPGLASSQGPGGAGAGSGTPLGWSTAGAVFSTLQELLASLGLLKYQNVFRREEVDLAALRGMSEDEIQQLGLPLGPRVKILRALGR